MIDSDALLARFARPTADQPTRIAVLSDLHLSLREHGTWRVSHRTEDRLEAAVRALNEQSLDGVLFNGDLVQRGARAEFDAFDRIVEDLEAPLFAVPGNHDLIGRSSGSQLTLPEFERRYAPGELPYRESRDLLPIGDGGSPGFANAAALVDVLAANDVPLVLTGHLHVPAVARAGPLREFTLPSLGPFPCGYTVFEIDGDGTRATFHPVVDFEGGVEAIGYGLDSDRVLLAAARMATLPLVDDARDSTGRSGDGDGDAVTDQS